MKKVLFSFLVILLLLVIPVNAQDIKEDKPEIETNIVLLTLFDINKEQVYKKDDFFELFYFYDEDYVLLPANLIVPYLEVELNFNRELSLLTLYKGNREVKVDLKDRKYLDHSEWDDWVPIIYGGEFYLTKEVFSYLTGYKIDWINSMQELYIEGEFIEELSQEDITDAEELEEEYKKEEKEILGDEERFQLSSVHYRIGINYEEEIFDLETKEIYGDLNFYGRSGNWAYYLNNDLSYDLNSEEIDYDLERIKFKYQENNKLIIIGDHSMNLENTLGGKDMQGIYFSIPDKLSYKLIPYTQLSLDLKKDDEISIYVNGKLFKSQTIKSDGLYTFNNIELRSKYLNKIEVVIIDKKGEQKIITKYLSGSSDIIQPGIKETELFAGRHRDDNYSEDEWEGYFAGVKSNYALNSSISAHTESFIYNEDELELEDRDSDDEILSSITGISFRFTNSAVVNLDWLNAGEMKNIESGAQANIIYSFLRGYIEGLYLYIPPTVEQYTEKEEGENASVNLRWDLNSRWSINPSIGRVSTLEDRLDKSDYYNFKIIYNPGWRNYNSLSLYYEENESEFLIRNNNNQLFLIAGDKIREGILLKNNIYGNSFRISSDLRYYDNQIEILDIYEDNYQEIEADLGFYKRFGNYLLLSLNYSGEQERDDEGVRYYDREYDGQLRLSFAERSSLTLGASRDYEESENGTDEIDNEDNERIEEEAFLRLNYFFNRDFSLTGELKDYSSEFRINYQSLYLSGNYYFPNNPGYIQLFGEYIIPEEGENGISFGAVFDKIRNDDSEIRLEIGREYSDYLNNDYEDYVMASYAHAFSFIGDEIKPSRFTDFEPRPIVAGYVYLDENYNGIMDAGEKKLANMPMRLGSMTALSGDDGMYIFKPYFKDLYMLNFDYRNLRADYTPITDDILVKIKDNQNIVQNFGVTINGTVEGKIFIDKNANGIKDEEDEDLMWGGVELKGLNKKDYTNARGE
ncbi:MAG: hypothetical protein ACQESS_02965, partial [Bacillota bacterium]